jgi:hypothetical protein
MRDPLVWQVRLLNAAGRPVGSGVVIDERHVVTGAHVVTQAQGQRAQLNAPIGTVEVDFLATDGARVPATVAAGGWVPTDPEGRGDIAVLELADPLPQGAEPASLRRSVQLWGHRFDVFGFPHGSGYETGVSASGVVGRQGGPGRQGWSCKGSRCRGTGSSAGSAVHLYTTISWARWLASWLPRIAWWRRSWPGCYRSPLWLPTGPIWSRWCEPGRCGDRVNSKGTGAHARGGCTRVPAGLVLHGPPPGPHGVGRLADH